MMTFVIVIHVIACVILVVLVLVQRGRGGGLVESFAGVESMFGTKTNAFLTKLTTVFAVVFFLTCLLLALLSVRQSKSLLSGTKGASVSANQEKPLKADLPVEPQKQTQPVKGATE